MASAVSEARCTLALRRTELLASRSDLQGRMGHATGALQEDQQRLTALQTEIEVGGADDMIDDQGGRR